MLRLALKGLLFCYASLYLCPVSWTQEPSQKQGGWLPPSSLQSLPIVDGLPDLFTFADGSKVETAEDWKQRRQELKDILLYFQYGSIPSRPDRVGVVEASQHPHASGLGTVEMLTLEIGSEKRLRFRAALYLPKHEGRRPVIIREEGTLGRTRDVSLFLQHGYIFIEYARHDLDPDQDRVVGLAQAAYPDEDWATLAVWAWCGMRLVDYLETREDVDLRRVGITGHSRGGKMALLAGALDERFSLVVPHQSGAGGAGCYRVLGPGAETLAQNDKPHWYHERIRWFGKRAERLPFDQHFLKALVAPRALLCTESADDEFANPLGSMVTSVAAQSVYERLGVPDKNGIHFRRGDHSTTTEDWKRLLEFAEWQFFDKPPTDREGYWQAPFPLPTGFGENLDRPLRSIDVVATQEDFRLPDLVEDNQFIRIGSPGNSPDSDHHGQGRYGAVDEVFEIGACQVSHVEYAQFLNAVAVDDAQHLYHPAMASGPGAIVQRSEPEGYEYLVRSGESAAPVTHVSWFDTVRYCNWLHNGRPKGSQGPMTTEDGAYLLTDTFECSTRQEEARYFLPSENQWYKAAYYVPDAENASYIHFALQESGIPLIDDPRPKLVSSFGMVEFADQVWEWTETPVGKLHRALRSGAWFLGNNRQAAGRFYSNPQIKYPTIGFRVARRVEN